MDRPLPLCGEIAVGVIITVVLLAFAYVVFALAACASSLNGGG